MSPRVRHLNTRDTLEDAISEGLGDVTLLEEMCPWGRALRAHRLALLPAYPHHLMLSGKDVISQFPAATATASTSCYASPP